MLFNI